MAPPPRPALAAVALALVALVAGCSSDGSADSAAPPPPSIQVPDHVDETCDDPVGDISAQVADEGTLAEPAGIDLVRGQVVMDGEALTVTFDVNGAIDPTPVPVYTLFQGPPGMIGSWELRTERGPDGVWTTTLFTYEQGSGRIQVGQAARPLDVVPTVDGATLTLEVPRSSLPPPLTLAWVFGAAAGEDVGSDGAERSDATVEPSQQAASTFDECDTLFGAAASGGGSGSTSPPTTR